MRVTMNLFSVAGVDFAWYRLNATQRAIVVMTNLPNRGKRFVLESLVINAGLKLDRIDFDKEPYAIVND